MLVLTRHASESIIIGNSLVKLKVLEVCGQSVRIGIDAPKELSVHREEIYHRIQSEQSGTPGDIDTDDIRD